MASTNVDHAQDSQNVSPLQGKRGLYEDMFYVLQSKPVYFARLARYAPATASLFIIFRV